MRYILVLGCFVVNKLRLDGTLVPKHVQVGTYKCFMTCFIVLQLMHFVCWKYGISENARYE